MKKILWSCMGLVLCLFFFKHPEIFADGLTLLAQRSTLVISNLMTFG